MKRWTMRLAPPFVMTALVIGFNACGSHDGGGGIVVEVEECTDYEAAFRSCASRLGPAARGMIEKQVASLRAGFNRVGTTEAAREELKTSCVDSARRLREVCR